MTIINPISTNIRQIIKTDNDFFVIREDYYKFDKTSNIYCLYNDEIIWFAELTSPEDYYTDEMILLNDQTIKSGTWGGFTVEIDIKTGKILQKSFTK